MYKPHGGTLGDLSNEAHGCYVHQQPKKDGVIGTNRQTEQQSDLGTRISRCRQIKAGQGSCAVRQTK